jgi:hypothetical protein
MDITTANSLFDPVVQHETFFIIAFGFNQSVMVVWSWQWSLQDFTFIGVAYIRLVFFSSVGFDLLLCSFTRGSCFYIPWDFARELCCIICDGFFSYMWPLEENWPRKHK